MSYNNNQFGFTEPGLYPSPGYPPQDRTQSSSSFPEPELPSANQGPSPTPGHPSQDRGQDQRSYPATGYADNQFVPYGQGRLEDKQTRSTGPKQEYVPPPGPPPAYTANPQSAPPSGSRVPLNSTSSFFPPPSDLGTPPCFDLDRSPLYFGSVILERSVHPCKVGTNLQPRAQFAYGGREQGHLGRYDVLPFLPQKMELVRTSRGQIPPGRRPIEGGYEENSAKLYHAVATVQGVRVPGKTGPHLGGANVGFGGEEHVVSDYEILCWK